MTRHVHFPDPSEKAPLDSWFYYVDRKDDADSPEMVHLWARAVLRQLARYEEAVANQQALEWHDRHAGTVASDAFYEAWCAERVELHFLMEAAVQMYRWASVADANDTSWEARRLLYDVPGADRGRWVKTLRDALVHFDEAYRGKVRAVRTVQKVDALKHDFESLAQAAWFLVGETQGDLEP